MARRNEQFVKGLSKVALWAGLFLIIIWLSLSWSRENRDNARLSVGESSGTAIETSETGNIEKSRVEVIAESLNLRSEPGTGDTQVIGTLKKGEVVEIISKKPGWLQVRLADGRTGYVTDLPQYIRAADE